MKTFLLLKVHSVYFHQSSPAFVSGVLERACELFFIWQSFELQLMQKYVIIANGLMYLG